MQRLVATFKLWRDTTGDFPKKSRYTLGLKIDSLYLEILELTFISAYLSKDQKLPYIQKAAAKLDLLKFFLQIAWEIKALDNKKYQLLAEPLVEIGKMFGGWIRQIEIQTKTKQR